MKIVDNQALNDQQIIDYLRTHPDFFKVHGSLLSELNLNHDSGKAVSLIERQVSVLRDRNIQTRRRMNDLLHAARLNDELFTKTRSLTLALLDVEAWHDLNEVLATNMLVDFDADFVCCHVHHSGLMHDHLMSHAGPMPHERFVTSSVPVCTTLRADELASLFPIQNHDTSGSAVLLPLRFTETQGCLAVGSRDPQHFSSDRDTLFVTYIADVLSRVINRLAK
jgi:uncharacterized protein YigA (DUF484 family)